MIQVKWHTLKSSLCGNKFAHGQGESPRKVRMVKILRLVSTIYLAKSSLRAVQHFNTLVPHALVTPQP